MNSRTELNPEQFAGAPFLPATYEFELLGALAAQPDGGSPLFERMIADGTPMEVRLSESGRALTLLFDPALSMLLVHDPLDPESGRFRWRRLRRLVLRNLVLGHFAGGSAALRERYPLLAAALSYPRPTLGGDTAFPALAQLEARCAVQLETSERVTFDLPPVPGQPGSDDFQAGLAQRLAGLQPKQVAALVQDDLYDTRAARAVPTVFPISGLSALAALVRHANPASRFAVSLVLPAETRLAVDLGHGLKTVDLETSVALVYLELSPDEVMEAIRSTVLTVSAEEVLEKNGLSLRSLSIRESRHMAAGASDP